MEQVLSDGGCRVLSPGGSAPLNITAGGPAGRAVEQAAAPLRGALELPRELVHVCGNDKGARARVRQWQNACTAMTTEATAGRAEAESSGPATAPTTREGPGACARKRRRRMRVRQQ